MIWLLFFQCDVIICHCCLMIRDDNGIRMWKRNKTVSWINANSSIYCILKPGSAKTIYLSILLYWQKAPDILYDCGINQKYEIIKILFPSLLIFHLFQWGWFSDIWCESECGRFYNWWGWKNWHKQWSNIRGNFITNITSSFVKDIGKVGDFYRHTKNVLDLLFWFSNRFIFRDILSLIK